MGQLAVVNVISSARTERFSDIAIRGHEGADIRTEIGIEFCVFDVSADAEAQHDVLSFHTCGRG